MNNDSNYKKSHEKFFYKIIVCQIWIVDYNLLEKLCKKDSKTEHLLLPLPYAQFSAGFQLQIGVYRRKGCPIALPSLGITINIKRFCANKINPIVRQ
jgi:hypothetical protein